MNMLQSARNTVVGREYDYGSIPTLNFQKFRYQPTSLHPLIDTRQGSKMFLGHTY
jgi:hypothetical protein